MKSALPALIPQPLLQCQLHLPLPQFPLPLVRPGLTTHRHVCAAKKVSYTGQKCFAIHSCSGTPSVRQARSTIGSCDGDVRGSGDTSRVGGGWLGTGPAARVHIVCALVRLPHLMGHCEVCHARCPRPIDDLWPRAATQCGARGLSTAPYMTWTGVETEAASRHEAQDMTLQAQHRCHKRHKRHTSLLLSWRIHNFAAQTRPHAQRNVLSFILLVCWCGISILSGRWSIAWRVASSESFMKTRRYLVIEAQIRPVVPRASRAR